MDEESGAGVGTEADSSVGGASEIGENLISYGSVVRCRGVRSGSEDARCVEDFGADSLGNVHQRHSYRSESG